MDGAAQDDGAIFAAAGFLSHFNDLTDARQAGKAVYRWTRCSSCRSREILIQVIDAALVPVSSGVTVIP